MNTITRFIHALGTRFRSADIGAYFVPMFRPMVREQDRLHPIRVVPAQSDRLPTLLSGSAYERSSQS